MKDIIDSLSTGIIRLNSQLKRERRKEASAIMALIDYQHKHPNDETIGKCIDIVKKHFT